MVDRIALRGFAGETPKVPPHYLPETHAASSINAALETGDLSPLRASALRQALSSVADSLYLHDATWLSWASDADAVPGPVATDRLYITRAGAAPVMRVDGVERPLALPTPTVAPTVVLTGTVNSAVATAYVYAWTWVTLLGEETAPSPLSPSILWSDGCTVTVGGMPNTPPANRLVTGKRIYRSETSATGETELFFVAEIPAANVSYVHDPALAPIQEAIRTKDFGPVPANLQGLTALPNGIMAGFRGKELWFSEPYQPHAWPSIYMLTTNDFIVALAAFGTSLAVLTTGMPYVVQGLHPEQMTMEKIEQPLPCVSKRSVVDMGYAAIYATPDGLVQIGTQGATLISQNLWTQRQWTLMEPHNIRAARYGQRYAFVSAASSTMGQAIAMVDTTGGAPFLVRSDDTARALFSHDRSGKLFYLTVNGSEIREFNPVTGGLKPYTWRSKPFRVTDSQPFGIAIVDTDGGAGSVTCIIRADGAEFYRSSVRDNPFRLPAGRGREWQIELTGTASVIQVRMATIISELGD
ncbi:hypothetical protein [Paracoccus sp. 22332]|uniref:hypothetical protein n=1 Tax=Paracoccus sp. 22332 TaxID=3453913 RepID=UPI003F8393AB